MKVRVEEIENEQKIVYLSGEITSTTASELDLELKRSISFEDTVVLDLSEVPYVSPAGIRVFMKLIKDMNGLGELSMVCVNDSVYEVFELVRLTFLIPVNRGQGDVDSDVESQIDEKELAVNICAITETEKEQIPEKIRDLAIKENARIFSLEKTGERLGLMAFVLHQDLHQADLLFVSIEKEHRGKGYVVAFMKAVQKKLVEFDVESVRIMSVGDVDAGPIARKLGYEKEGDPRYILHYGLEQLKKSKLMAKMDQLRTMLDKVKVIGELDFFQQMELGTFIEGDIDDLDLVFARCFVVNGRILGVMNAVELSEGDIWLKMVNVIDAPETKPAIPLMLASVIDGICAIYVHDVRINIVCGKEYQKDGYIKVLGEPISIEKNQFYIMTL